MQLPPPPHYSSAVAGYTTDYGLFHFKSTVETVIL
jgi:hypothetical protein